MFVGLGLFVCLLLLFLANLKYLVAVCSQKRKKKKGEKEEINREIKEKRGY